MQQKNDTVTMSLRMDKELKRQAEAIFAEIGVSMTTALNIFLRKAVREGGFPFELKVDVPNAETLAALVEVEAMKADPSIGKAYTDVDAMMKELLS